MPFLEPLWKKIERQNALREQYPEFDVAQSPDKVLQVDNYRLRNGGPISEWSQAVMRLARHAAELEQQRQVGAPDLIQGSADWETYNRKRAANGPVPGVPRAVAEIDPEGTAGLRQYGTPGSLDESGQLWSNTAERINRPIAEDLRNRVPGVGGALDTPVLGTVLREATRPTNWMSAAIAPLSFAPRAGMGVRVGAEIASATASSLVGQKVSEVTGNQWAGLGAGLLAGQLTGAGVSRVGGLAGQADNVASSARRTPVRVVGKVSFEDSKALDGSIDVNRFADVSDSVLNSMTRDEEDALLEYVRTKEGVSALRTNRALADRIASKSAPIRDLLRGMSPDGRTIRAYRFESGIDDTAGLESWALSPKAPRAFSNIFSGGRDPITVADIDINSVIAAGATDDLEILVRTDGGLFGQADNTLATLTRPAPVLGGAAPLDPAAVLRTATPGSSLFAAAESAQRAGTTIPAGIGRSLYQAESMVKADRPSAVANAFYRIPGTKRLLRPGLNMNDNIVEAYAARTSAQAEWAQVTASERSRIISQLDSVFGKGAAEGNKLNLRYLGPTADRRYSAIDTLYDVMQRPNMYDLTPEQSAAVAAYGARNDSLRKMLVEDYGAKLGEFQPSNGVYVPNVDRSEAARGIDEAIGRSEEAAASTGRNKTRVYDSGFERWQNEMADIASGTLRPDQVFVPETNVLKLTEGIDKHGIRTVGQQVFLAGLGGKTKLDVLKETHPSLYTQMTSLRQRLSTLRGTAGRLNEKLDDTIAAFNSSAMNESDINALLANLTPKGVRGSTAGWTEDMVRTEINNIRDQIRDLQPAWNAANPRGYEFVGDGIYRYFKPEDVRDLRTLLRTEGNEFFQAIGEINASVLSGDFSPIVGQQGQLAWLTAPIQTTKAVFGGLARGVANGDPLRAFKSKALMEDIARDPQSWQDFAFYTGRAAGPGAVPGEFGGGWIARIPVVGEKFTAANDAIYTAVIRAQKRMFDDEVQSLARGGVSGADARAIAARSAMQVIPTPNQSLAGLSPAKARVPRSLATSITFIQRPAQVLSEASEGLARMVTGQNPTAQQKIALRNLIKMQTTAMGLAAGSAALEAMRKGEDPQEAALAAINPRDKHFMGLVIPGGPTVPLGGPYRSLFRAMAPRPVKTGEGEEVWVPFGGMADFLRNRISPTIARQVDVLRNEDFNGNKIMTRDFPFNILQVLEYEGEGVLPLTAATVPEAVRTGGLDAVTTKEGLGDIASNAASSVAGFTPITDTPLDKLNEIARKKGGKDFYDLEPNEQQAIRDANPKLSEEEIARGSEERQLSEKVRAESEQRLQSAWDRFAQDGDINALKDARAEIRNQLDGAMGVVWRDHPDRKPDPKKPWEMYGKVIADNTDPQTGEIDWDKVDEWRASLDDAQNAAIDRNTGYRAPEEEKKYRAVGNDLRGKGFFDLKKQAWDALKAQYPGKLDQFAEYDDWSKEELRSLTKEMIAKGVPVETARKEAEVALGKYTTATKFSEFYRSEFRHRFVVDNKDLALKAVYYGYFEPDAAERKFLRLSDGTP